ncbi:MAG: hypothetical protein M5U10_02555 [Candidatus Methanoperedens sp.]|uniref:hypothetical protein n=1 Tax=Candidatus Methanoperedens nitratireducens TaxID=1392998 RepID=UPI00064E8FFA|nr:hypothetical protein [Candidatus Methanoperedens nitroreducens]MDJ1420776.1 hypothetical protein [Candidatus Methanoperedens sp.]
MSVEAKPSCLNISHEKKRDNHVTEIKPKKMLKAIRLSKLSTKLKKKLNIQPKKRPAKIIIKEISTIPPPHNN